LPVQVSSSVGRSWCILAAHPASRRAVPRYCDRTVEQVDQVGLSAMALRLMTVPRQRTRCPLPACMTPHPPASADCSLPIAVLLPPHHPQHLDPFSKPSFSTSSPDLDRRSVAPHQPQSLRV
jgi:hypothetical protein